MALTLSPIVTATSSPSPYPPGVLTGRPLEMFEAAETLDLYGVPEQWFSTGNRGGLDVEMLQELCDALDHRHDEEMQWIGEELLHLEHPDQAAYYVYPMVEDGGAPCPGRGIKEALMQFEEDFDYEETLIQEEIDNNMVNFHRLLATPPNDRPGWCGEEIRGKSNSKFDELQNNELIKERYRFMATMLHDFPSDRMGYGLAQTTYGKIYIPEKFRKYVPGVGETVELTVALQDVWPRGKKKVSNTFRFSAIYLH